MKLLLLIMTFILMIFQSIQMCSAFGYLWRDKMEAAALTNLAKHFRKTQWMVGLAIPVLGAFTALYAGFPEEGGSVVTVHILFITNAIVHVVGVLLTLILMFKNAVLFVRKISEAAKKGSVKMFLQMLVLALVSVLFVFLFL